MPDYSHGKTCGSFEWENLSIGLVGMSFAFRKEVFDFFAIL
jgi:hypothetical protein